MKRLFYILPALVLMTVACTPDPYAEFTANPNPAYVGEYVLFASYSSHTSYVEWNMGDGFTYQVPTVDHYYMDPGYYDVQLKAFGSHGGVDVAYREIEVIGSEVTIEVRDYETDVLIPNVEINLFLSLEDWDTGDLNLSLGPYFTDRYGQVTIYDLSYQKYYVDAYYRDVNTGYVNWELGLEDPAWIETQLLTGWEYHTFVAYVDFVEFTDKKSAAENKIDRSIILRNETAAKSAGIRELKENKSTEGTRRK